MFKEALLFNQEQNKIRCLLCPRRCLIGEGQKGFCLIRENRGGKLFTLIYGEVASISLNPIEKKPVFHFYPGSKWLSLGTFGCNFRCPGCQNWELSYGKPKGDNFISPKELVNLAKRTKALGISWTFNEPTIWMEYAYEGAVLAKKEGLFTNFVTNGYITPEALDFIGPYIDVYRVDIKGFSKESYGKIAHIPDPKPIFEAVKRAKEKWGMHIELVTNVIPGYNDSELPSIADWILKEMGPFTPWHITRFFPHLELSHLPPTPIKTLEEGYRMAREKGLFYVYIGNIPGHPYEDTHCHNCGKTLIRRDVFNIVEYKIQKGRCPYCQALIPGRFA